MSRSRRLLQVELTGSGCWWAVLLRGALLGGVLLLLCASLLVPLHAHQASYHFTFYTAFTHWYDVARFYARAVPLPIIGLAVIGFPLALRRGFYARTLALTLPVSIVVISLAGWYLRHLSIFAQLEGGRLISVLRVPTLFLAAFALHELLRLLLRYLRLPSATLVSGLLAVCLVAALVVSAHSPLPASDRGLPKIVTTDQPAFADVAASAYNMERLTTPADRALVLADPIAMHTSIWIPALTGRAAYFGDWLWSWRDYPYGYEDRFRDWSQGLDADWLRENGITVVMVARTAPDLMDLAERAPYLVMLDPGNGSGYAIFRVNLPDLSNGWVNVAGGTVDGVQVGPERLSAQLHAPSAGVAMVTINAFPGWQAVVNGHAVPVTRSADGFMEVPVPAGNSSLVLRYTTTGVVWLGRGLTAAGVLLLLVLVLLPRWVRRPAEAAPAPWRELVETEV